MEHIAPILENLLARRHLRQGVADYTLFTRWAVIVGEALAAGTAPLRVQGGVLWVAVDNATLQHHLSFLVPRMLQRIREEAPGSAIESIRFVPSERP